MGMKNYGKRLLTAALTIGAAVSAFAMPVSAQRQFEDCIPNCKVYDVQDVLTDAEEAELNQEILSLSEEIDMYIAVYIYGPETYFSSDWEVTTTADDNYDALFNPQADVDTDGVLLIINNSTKYDYISTSGMGQLYYYNGAADNRVQYMFDSMRPYLESEDYVGAVGDYLENLDWFYETGIPKNAYTYNESTGMYHYSHKGELKEAKSLPFWFGKSMLMLVGLPIGIGLLAALIAYFSISISYKRRIPLSPTNYISRKDTRFTVQQDMFLRKYVTKQHIDRDGGGGGGGGGGGSSHSSSGGHSHGGGGSHR